MTNFSTFKVNCTRIYVLILGTIIGFTGMIHGIFEILTGNIPTGGFLLKNIGAFTLIPNYLLTGIISLIISLFIIIWVVGFIHKKNGPIIFLCLSVALFLTGGGVAIVIGFLITWGVSTKINKPISGLKKFLPVPFLKLLSKFWLTLLITGFTLLLTGILIWLILVPPGTGNKLPVIQYICWAFLFAALLFQILTILSGFARDQESLL